MIGINVILAVLVAGLVMAGWFIANQHQLLTESQSALSQAQGRLQTLEDRLISTDAQSDTPQMAAAREELIIGAQAGRLE